MIHPNMSRAFVCELFEITKTASLDAADPDYVHKRSLKAGLGFAPSGAAAGSMLGLALTPGGWKGKALGTLAGAALGGAGAGGLSYLAKRPLARKEQEAQKGLIIRADPGTQEKVKALTRRDQLRAAGSDAFLGGGLGWGLSQLGPKGVLPKALATLGGAALGGLSGYAKGPAIEEEMVARGKTRAAEHTKNYLAMRRAFARRTDPQLMLQEAMAAAKAKQTAPTSEV